MTTLEASWLPGLLLPARARRLPRGDLLHRLPRARLRRRRPGRRHARRLHRGDRRGPRRPPAAAAARAGRPPAAGSATSGRPCAAMCASARRRPARRARSRPSTSPAPDGGGSGGSAAVGCDPAALPASVGADAAGRWPAVVDRLGVTGGPWRRPGHRRASSCRWPPARDGEPLGAAAWSASSPNLAARRRRTARSTS